MFQHSNFLNGDIGVKTYPEARPQHVDLHSRQVLDIGVGKCSLEASCQLVLRHVVGDDRIHRF